MKYGLFIMVTVLISCTKDNLNTNQVALDGKWVDVNTNTDTLTFGLSGDKESMILARGKEMRNGFLLPKYGSGSYDYKLLTAEKISLHWTLSSDGIFTGHYFKQVGDNLTIEKFFDFPTAATLLTFKKIN